MEWNEDENSHPHSIPSLVGMMEWNEEGMEWNEIPIPFLYLMNARNTNEMKLLLLD